MNILGVRPLSALPPAPIVVHDAAARDTAEDPCQILGDPWNGRDRALGDLPDDRRGIRPFARLTRRRH
jgi:hypothetical protein